ncbi:MAG: cation:proton antiporter subunit C [Defluviitaleaceae bacterium]|nr:cation:proton antiporter subunit C [Defluviitaleaceae bacterium]
MELFGLNILELFPVLLFFISIFGLMTANNVVKSVIYMITLNAGVITFWIVIGARAGTVPPILETPYTLETYFYHFSDPVPQALMITTIIIGFCITAINIIMLNTIFRRYKSTDWRLLRGAALEETAALGYDGTLSDMVYEHNYEKDMAQENEEGAN